MQKNNTNGIMVITSDSGLLGGMNHILAEKATLINKSNKKYYAVGEKGQMLFESSSIEHISIKGIETITDKIKNNKNEEIDFSRINYDQVILLAKDMVKRILNGEIGSLTVLYPKSSSFSKWDICESVLFPCEEISLIKNKKIKDLKKGLLNLNKRLIVESSYSDMAKYLSEIWATAKFLEIFEDSKLAELSARSIHLNSATQNIKENISKLEIEYRDTRKDLIDKQLREVTTNKQLRERKQSLKNSRVA